MTQKAWSIIAYTYDADYHCIHCTIKQFRQNAEWSIDVDEHGIRQEIEDSEGNFVKPLFATDEWQEFDPSYMQENPIQILECGTCHDEIDRWEEEKMTKRQLLNEMWQALGGRE
jgi:hypothetical protein